MTVSYIQLDEDDLINCAELYVSIFKQAPWNEEWSHDDAFERLGDFLACPKSIGIKAVYEKKIVGFLLGEVQRWNGANYFYLKEICVANKLQRQGIGKLLMAKLNQKLSEIKVERIYLITQRSSIPSEFYSSIGFSSNESVVVMGKPIKKSN